MNFLQAAPQLGNQYTDDRVLRSYLRRTLPAALLSAIEPELLSMGEAVAGEWLSQQLAERNREPWIEHWDAWGERIDRVHLSPFWERGPEIATRFGLIAHGYETRNGVHARLHQFALVYLFQPSSEFYTCPLAMTDGAARCLMESGNARLIERAVPHFLSRDPATFWTSGQWMTETTGGSDVGATESVARKDEGGRWRLFGRKWFTSAVHGQAALTLARPQGNGNGTDNLALFYVEPRKSDGRLRQIQIDRLKDKLGTRKLPTAEIHLQGTPAEIVGESKHGVRAIAPVLNITRTWNSIGAVAYMRRGIALARDYANRRVVFGAPLSEQPLHQETLAGIQAEYEANFHLAFYLVELLGRREQGPVDEAHESLLRLLTPVVKLLTARTAVELCSELIECFGGAGYVEDTGLPLLLRDAQVLPIWEGTTNVLALDCLRVLRAGSGMQAWLSAQRTLLAQADAAELEVPVRLVRESTNHLLEWLQKASSLDKAALEAGARGFALSLGRILALALLCRHASWSLRAEADPRPAAAARRFARHGLLRLNPPGESEARMLATDTYS